MIGVKSLIWRYSKLPKHKDKSKTFCAFCDTEAVKTIKTEEGNIMPMCHTCHEAFEYGTAIGDHYEDIAPEAEGDDSEEQG